MRPYHARAWAAAHGVVGKCKSHWPPLMHIECRCPRDGDNSDCGCKPHPTDSTPVACRFATPLETLHASSPTPTRPPDTEGPRPPRIGRPSTAYTPVHTRQTRTARLASHSADSCRLIAGRTGRGQSRLASSRPAQGGPRAYAFVRSRSSASFSDRPRHCTPGRIVWSAQGLSADRHARS